MTRPEWAPLLAGNEAEDARRAIAAVRILLAERGSERAGDRIGLSWGVAGRALWHAYVSLMFAEEAAPLETAVDRIFSAPLALRDASLFGGASGVAWVIQHLTADPRFGVTCEGDPNDRLDPALWARWQELEDGPFDLVSGIVGAGVYALERLPDASARAVLERIVAALDRRAARDPMSLWRTDPAWLGPRPPAAQPSGHVDLGHAHGLAGVLAFLCRVHAAQVGEARAAGLIARGIEWLLAQRLPEGQQACFPHTVGDQQEPGMSRLAWCYGDLSAAVALCMAGRQCDQPRWLTLGMEVARRAARRPMDRSGVEDCGLCHGAAGIAHIFNRLHQWSGDAVLGDAARGWFRQLLRLRDGNGAFFARLQDDAGVVHTRREPGFLMGASGAGLALLAAVDSTEPCWDRVLLLSPLG